MARHIAADKPFFFEKENQSTFATKAFGGLVSGAPC
jgi:hypothetical protein